MNIMKTITAVLITILVLTTATPANISKNGPKVLHQRK
jgi:hypothetical protein